MSLANIATVLALTAATSYACKVKGGFCNDMFPCCDQFVCEDIGGGVTTCQFPSQNSNAQCATHGQEPSNDVPCCAGHIGHTCWFDESKTCCTDSKFFQ